MKPAAIRGLGALVKATTIFCIFMASGCAILESQAEIPSLENQVNRIVSGLDAVRTNEIISSMTISSDAKWPNALDEDITDKTKELIDRVLETDPYIATHVYTDKSQQDVLGGFYTPKVGALVYDVVNRLVILYGLEEKGSYSKWPKHWPSAFVLGSDLSSFNTFENKGKPKRVTAISGNSHKGYAAAVISLMPENFQKDLEQYKKSMDDSIGGVVSLKAKIGELRTRLQSEAEGGGSFLTESEAFSINSEIATLEAELAAKESVYDEYEEIYLTKLDEATEILKGDINLDEENVKLAKNISMVAQMIRMGALDAGTAFGVALFNLSSKEIIQNFPNEIASLGHGRNFVPNNKLELFEQRTSRLTENGLYALPALGVGAYYAVKQSILASKYEDIAQVVLDADAARKEAELAMSGAQQ